MRFKSIILMLLKQQVLKLCFNIILALIFCLPVVNATLTDNLISYWKFNGDFTDTVGGYTLSNTGMTSTTGIFNNAVNGTSVQYASNWNYKNISTTEMSISFWFKLDSVGAVNHRLLSRFSGVEPLGKGWFIQSASGYVLFGLNDGVGSFSYGYTPTGTIATAHTWYYTTITYKQGDIDIYVNAVNKSLSLSGVIDTTIADTKTPLYLNALNLSGRLQGGINKFDELIIYNRKLTQSEVTTLYNSGTGYEIPLSSPCDYTSGDKTFEANCTITSNLATSRNTIKVNGKNTVKINGGYFLK